jgi:hypothetical protein
MLKLSSRPQWIVGLVLASVMAVTRGGHFATLDPLPESSWAVFLLAGVYLRSWLVLPALLLEAALLDWSAVAIGGISTFCVSVAYVALIPAYAALWGAGRWYAAVYRPQLATLFHLALAVFGGGLACELISSGSFYFFSGRFAEPTLAGLVPRLLRFAPNNVSTVALYTVVAAAVHVIAVGLARRDEVGSAR